MIHFIISAALPYGKKFIISILLVASIGFFFLHQNYPRVQSHYHFRIANRKHVSHILLETIQGRNTITFLMSHPSPYHYKSSSHPLYYTCGNAADCIKQMKKIDQFLKSGYNLGLSLQGSYIKEIRYYHP